MHNGLIKYINKLELNSRTNLIYWASMHYEDNSIWYTDPTIMSVEYLKDIKTHYNKNFKKKNISSNRKNELEGKLVKLFNKFADNGIIRELIEKKLGYYYSNPLCILNNADFNIVNISIKDKLVDILNRC